MVAQLMPNLNRSNRRTLAQNLRWISSRMRIPFSEFARAACVDAATIEKWLDMDATERLIISQDQLRRLADSLKVRAMSSLYGMPHNSFRLHYLADVAKNGESPKDVPEDPAPAPPKPKRAYHRKPKESGADQADPPIKSIPISSQRTAEQSGQSIPSIGSMSDSDLRSHLLSLLNNPLISIRDAIRAAAKFVD
jgi:hypothetical protein